MTGRKGHGFRSQAELALALGDFLTSCVTLGSLGRLSLGFLSCRVGEKHAYLAGLG